MNPPAELPADATGALRARLQELGFDVVRFTRCGPVPAAALTPWLEAGYAADMAWIERGAARRLDPQLVLPGAQSIVALGVNYGRPAGRSVDGHAAWARYALHTDYHESIERALAAAVAALAAAAGLAPGDSRAYVDTGPVLERGWAARAGVGFLGKNAMLISRDRGNWLFLAAVLTRAVLPADEPLRGGDPVAVAAAEARGLEPVGRLCGRCTRCLDACPTQALTAPGVLDARRCISYQTIENKGVIPRALRAGIGDRLYGCDICAAVCPWNRFAQTARSVVLEARPEIEALTLPEVLALTPERFAAVFRKTAIKRVKLAGLLRNACLVAGNSGAPALLPAVLPLAQHASPLVRAHAVWAVYRLAGAAHAAELLAPARAGETDASVLAEYTAEAASAAGPEAPGGGPQVVRPGA